MPSLSLPTQPAEPRPPATRRPASVKHLPVNLFASVMGLAGLSIAWRQASRDFELSPVMADIAGHLALVVFALLAVSYLIKAIRHPGAVLAEYRHPVAGNFFGTITIAMLLLSTVLTAMNQMLAILFWTVGAIFTIALCFAITGRLMRGKIDIAHAVPAWFIPGVATLDIVVAGGAMPMAWAHEINMFALAIGTAIALLFFTMIMSRMIHHEPLPASMIPSLLILMAPFEVGFLAYTNFTQHIDTFAGLLFYVGLFIFLAVAPKVFRRGVPFASGWWAISFPMAALALASLKYAAYTQAWPMRVIAAGLLGLLSLAIVVLFAKTIRILLNGQLLAG
ncbi:MULTISPECIES: SLAC1 anion channel family protein [unclassified Achromobacter]|uniref:SLAC1 anion channel family protein n=1 Tax=unclassified Achromobacter TaxID=2626865 RepID=UPI0021018CC7|nr:MULTISPECIES: SLAC1 anion channel family protein [unclassified Achromobacter]